MKKTVVFIALLSIVVSVSAQTMNVQTAYSDMKNERYASAKENIDAACLNEKTKDDAKTWNYAGLIYAQIVDASQSTDKSKQKLFKKQKIDTPVEQLCRQGIEALKKSLEIEQKNGTHEYMSSSLDAMKLLCSYQYIFAATVYNKGDYTNAIPLLEEVAKNAQIAGHNDALMDSKYYEAESYRLLKQDDKALDLYRELAKLNTTTHPDAYLRVYNANRAANDTVKALNVLKRGVKNTVKDTATNISLKSTLASAYYWANQPQEGDKIAKDMLANGQNNTQVLNSVANIYVDGGDAEKATELFNKSIAINNNQLEPYRGLGLVYFNKAVADLQAAANVPMEDQAGYDKLIAQSNEHFKQAIPHFKKALEIKDNDFSSLKALTTIYSKLQMKDEYQATSAKLQQLLQK